MKARWTAVREGGAARLFDTWLAGEWTRFELHLDGLGDGTASVQLLYTFNADRNDPATLERWQELGRRGGRRVRTRRRQTAKAARRGFPCAGRLVFTCAYAPMAWPVYS